MIRKKIAAAAAAWFCAFPSHAIDALALEVGYGEDRTSRDFSAALWDNAVESTADLGITPVFRFERGALNLEAAIGLDLVQTRISASRVFSTAFQSGDHVGIGWHSGRWDFAARLPESTSYCFGRSAS